MLRTVRARQRSPSPEAWAAYLAENNQLHCAGAREVLALNRMEAAHLSCAAAAPRGLRSWARDHDHIDLIDMDIQGTSSGHQTSP